MCVCEREREKEKEGGRERERIQTDFEIQPLYAKVCKGIYVTEVTELYVFPHLGTKKYSFSEKLRNFALFFIRFQKK
jgi:hypothetical protein